MPEWMGGPVNRRDGRMGWNETAAILLRRRAAAVARAAPPALRPISLPAVDADVPIPVPAHEIDFVGLLAEIGYRDGRSVPSERRVTIRRSWCTASDATLDCWCHERAGPRRLLASRIYHAIDPLTGETVGSIGDFLERFLFVSGRLPETAPLASQLARLRPALYLLACLARPGLAADRGLVLDRAATRFAAPALVRPGLAALLDHMAYDAELFERASAAALDLDDRTAAWAAQVIGDLVGLAEAEDAGAAPWLAAWATAAA